MPRARSPNRDKAFELWIASEGRRELKDIAEELGVSPEQVRKWKHTDKWDERTHKVTLPNGKGNVTKRNPGGQRGNKNAVGHGPPLGSQNALKHGAYERIMAGLLSKDEAEVFNDDDTGTEVEAELRRTLAALNTKEIRLMKRINSITNSAKSNQIVRGVDKTTIVAAERQTITATHTTSMYDALEKLEAELDRVQGRKIKALSQIESIRVNRKRLEMEKQRIDGEREKNKAADAWISALTGVAVEDENDISEAD